MKLNDNVEKALNQQINIEWSASYYFLGISAWFETTPFKGFSKALLERSERELRHAMQFLDFLKTRLGVIELLPIDEPQASFNSPIDAFEKALARKHAVTQQSHKLYALAVKENDFETQEFLHQFFQEQIQEEKNMQDNVDKVGFAKKNADALIHLDYKEEILYAASKMKS